MLTSIIFLFVKHPYDVGDRVSVMDKTYTVKEIRLLSTIFLDGNACLVQAPNTVLNDNVGFVWPTEDNARAYKGVVHLQYAQESSDVGAVHV